MVFSSRSEALKSSFCGPPISLSSNGRTETGTAQMAGKEKSKLSFPRIRVLRQDFTGHGPLLPRQLQLHADCNATFLVMNTIFVPNLSGVLVKNRIGKLSDAMCKGRWNMLLFCH